MRIVNRYSRASVLYKGIIYIFVFVAFFLLIMFPIMYSSVTIKTSYSLAFIGVFVVIPTKIAMLITLAIYAVVLVFLTFKTAKFDRDVLYLLGEALFISYVLTTIVAMLFPKSIYQGSPEEYNKELFNQMYSVLIAPLFEEMFFRLMLIGIPLVLITRNFRSIVGKVDVSALSNKKRIAVIIIMLISSICFGIAHSILGFWGVGKAFVASIQGLYLALLFVYFGFLANLTLHFIINTLSFFSLWAVFGNTSNIVSPLVIAVTFISMMVLVGSVLSAIALPIRIIEKVRSMRIIAIVGYPGAGKTEVRRLMEELYGLKGVAMGDVVRAYAEKLGVPMTPEEISRFADNMRRIHGMDYWARKTVEYIKELARERKLGRTVIIDGVRNIEEIEYFKRVFGENLIIVCVNAPEEIRLQRLLERGRKDDIKTVEDLRMRDEIERSWGLDRVIGMADYVIENVGTIEDLKKAVKEVVESIRRSR